MELIRIKTDNYSSSSGMIENSCIHFEIDFFFHFGFNIVCYKQGANDDGMMGIDQIHGHQIDIIGILDANQ